LEDDGARDGALRARFCVPLVFTWRTLQVLAIRMPATRATDLLAAGCRSRCRGTSFAKRLALSANFCEQEDWERERERERLCRGFFYVIDRWQEIVVIFGQVSDCGLQNLWTFSFWLDHFSVFPIFVGVWCRYYCDYCDTHLTHDSVSCEHHWFYFRSFLCGGEFLMNYVCGFTVGVSFGEGFGKYFFWFSPFFPGFCAWLVEEG
jgi:hypothetical protein